METTEQITGTPAEMFRIMRQLFDLNITQAATAFGVCPATIINWEKEGPKYTTPHRYMLEGFGINPDWINCSGSLIISGNKFEDVKRKIKEAAGCKK